MANFNTQIGVTGALSRGEAEASLSLLKAKATRTASKLAVGQAIFSGATQAASLGARFKQARGDNEKEDK